MFMHRSRDGNELLLAEMDDSHLDNTIKMLLNKLKIAKKILKNEQMTRFETLLNGTCQLYSKEDAERFVKFFGDRFAHYLLELFLLGFDANPYIAEYRLLLGRESQIHSDILALEEECDEEDLF